MLLTCLEIYVDFPTRFSLNLCFVNEQRTQKESKNINRIYFPFFVFNKIPDFHAFSSISLFFFKSIQPCSSGISQSPNVGLPVVPKVDTTIRAKRLMKEFKEIIKSQSGRAEPIFSVNYSPIIEY